MELRSVEAHGRVVECLGSLSEVWCVFLGSGLGLKSFETENPFLRKVGDLNYSKGPISWGPKLPI